VAFFPKGGKKGSRVVFMRRREKNMPSGIESVIPVCKVRVSHESRGEETKVEQEFFRTYI